MPSRAPSVCGACGKTHLTSAECSIIAARNAARKAKHDKTRPNARSRGYDAEWEREAKAFLSLPENRSCQCGAPAVLVAHRKSIRQRPDLRMVKSNWRPSCQRCNAIEAAQERAQGAQP